METWRVELTAGRKSLAEVKIQWCILIAIMPFNPILMKCAGGYKLSRKK